MSILYSNSNNSVIISHEKFIENIYMETKDEIKTISLTLKKDLFNIVNPFLRDSQVHNKATLKNMASWKSKKRKTECHLSGEFENEVEMIKTKLNEIFQDDSINNIFLEIDKDSICSLKNNIEARSASKMYFESLTKEITDFNGRNINSFSICVCIDNKKYVIPPNSIFFNCDVLHFFNKIEEDLKFDFILMDPPWRNKYIRRKRKLNCDNGYKMMYNKEISSIPVDKLLSKDGLVAVWCTNSINHINSLIKDIFPSWGLKYVCTWFWVKVTKYGETICEFSQPPGKQPYERIIFGCSLDRSNLLKNPEDKNIIISIPSAIHSHKPPLCDIIPAYLVDAPKCLELFARYLLPNWTSCGDQVLSLQNLNLYESNDRNQT